MLGSVERDLARRALDTARSRGATYSDARFVRRGVEDVLVKNAHLENVDRSDTYGFSVRAIAEGAWGFAASPVLTADEADRVAATAEAEANRSWRGAAAELDRLIHERVRLAIVSALAVRDSLTFNELKALLKTSDGNLSVHARKLEDADYVTCVKSFAGRVPKTEYRLTALGRRALERYLDHMEALIRATRAR